MHARRRAIRDRQHLTWVIECVIGRFWPRAVVVLVEKCLEHLMTCSFGNFSAYSM